MNQNPEESQNPEPTTESSGTERQGPGAAYPLADRVSRLAAVVIDTLINSMIIIPIMLMAGVPEYIEAGEPIPSTLAFQLAFAGFAVFLLIHGFLLYQSGQTVGKKIMKIAIVDLSGNVPSFNRMIGLRYLPFWFAGNVPQLALIPFVDALFIFRQDRRCLHDLLAGTRVIDVSAAENA